MRKRADVFEIEVSLFDGYREARPSQTVSLLDFVLNSTCKERILEIRRCEKPKYRSVLKSRLPAVTPSGIFEKRSKACLIRHSGVICVDIDGKENPTVTDFEALKSEFKNLAGCFYAGVSASGQGVFLLVRIATPEAHVAHFRALSARLATRGIVVDKACKDITRLRGASYDPLPFLNLDAGVFTETIETVVSKPTIMRNDPPKPSLPIQSSSESTRQAIAGLVQRIERTRTDLTDRYTDWFAIGCSLAAEFGEDGRAYYHAVSRQSLKYDYKECDRQFDKCKVACTRSSIRTFFWYCRVAGLMARETVFP